MATQHAIGITLTANAQNAVTEIGRLDREMKSLMTTRALIARGNGDTSAIDRQLAALRRQQNAYATSAGLTDRLTFSQKKFRTEMNSMTKGSGRMQQAFGQLAFAGEDFMSVIDTMGVRGGMRAAGNNLSMVARIAGGPLLGGLIGIGLVAIPSMLAGFEEADKKVKKFTDTLSRLDRVREMVASGMKAETKIEFQIQDLKADGFKSTEEADKAILSTQRKIRELQEEIQHLATRGGDVGQEFWKNFEPKLGLSKVDTALRDMFGSDAAAAPFRADLAKLKADFQKDLITFADRPDLAIQKFDQNMQAFKESVKAHLGPGIIPDSVFEDWTGQGTHAGRQFLEGLERAKGTKDEVLADEESLDEIRKAGLDTQDKITESKKLEALEAKKLSVELQKQQDILAQTQRDAATSLNELGRSSADRLLLDLRKEQEQVRKLGTTAGPAGAAAAKKAEERVLEAALEKLQSSINKQTEVFKDEALQGPAIADMAEAAKRSAEAQIRDADNKKDDNKDMLDAMKSIEKALARKTLIAVPVP